MNDTTQTLVRSILKIGAGALVSHGFADDNTAEVIVAGICALLGVLWGVAHRSNGTVSVPINRGPVLVLFATLILALGAGGCVTALKSDKIIAVKQRSFGIIIGQSPTTQSPEVHLGFVSTVWDLVPTSTNVLYSPKYADTFQIQTTGNPFHFDVDENVGSGDVATGTNGESTAIWPPK